ncbi:MAG: CHASE2 domain-containing protein [Cyanobacteria bacterium P01_A01_bin.84]
MSLEDLDDLDIQTLRKLLEQSGRADPERREALCIEIDVKSAELSAIKTKPTHDFVIELIDLLQKRKLETSIYNLCLQLQSVFKESTNASQINAIVRKIKDDIDTDSTSDNINTQSSLVIESTNQPIPKTPEQVNPKSSKKQITITPQITPQVTPQNRNNPPQVPRWRKIFLRFVGNDLSLRKAFILSLIVTTGVVGLRFFTVFEWLELKAFDHFMQLRFIPEDEDNSLLIVKITDNDIQAQDRRGELGYGNSLRDSSLDKLLTILQEHKPRVIGLDFYRSKSVVDKNKTPNLVKRLQQNNIVTVCKAPLTDEEGKPILSSEIPPPPEIKSLDNLQEKVGFSDFIRDIYIDNHVRRHLMAQDIIPGTECRTKESFSLLLARRYLEQEPEGEKKYKITIKSGEHPRIGDVTFPAVESFTGGYQGINSSGFQVLLNYRVTTSGNLAKELTLEDILNNRFDAKDIEDKIILIGSYAYGEGPRDEWYTPYGSMNGVTVHAQMVSQIISTVRDGRPLLRVYPQGIEIIWIGTWSFLGGFLVCYLRPLKIIGLVAILSSILILYITCLTTLTIASLWIPFIPALLGFTITSVAFFIINYLYRD